MKTNLKSSSLLIRFMMISIFSGLVQFAQGQTRIRGSVQDNVNKPIPFANVLLLQSTDSSLVLGAVTSIDGEFNIMNVQPGKYLLKITMIGYESVNSSIFEVEKEQNEIVSNTIQMHEDTRQLDEVVVSALRPLYEKQADRTIVNVQNSITSSGKTALEVIERSPGILVNRQNNSISMNGKNGILVMVNGKITRLPIDAVVQMLDGMSAANIEKIELITSPPAKYDAEGDAGIINIVMIENTDLGTNGNFGLTAGYNKGATLGANFNMNYRSKAINFFMNYSILSDRNEAYWSNDRTLKGDDFNQTVATESWRSPLTNVQNLRAGLEFNLSKKTTASFLITGYRRNFDMDAITHNQNISSPDTTTFTIMNLHENNIWQSGSGSLAINTRLDDQSQLGLSLDYLYYHNNNPSNYFNTVSINDGADQFEQISVSKKTPIQFKIAKLDYSNQVNSDFTIDAGMKVSLSEFNNKVGVDILENQEWVTDPGFTNESNLDERILAGYVSWKWEASTNFIINGGIRYEYTDSYLSTPDETGLVDRQFGNFFPTLFISQGLSEESKIQLAYNRRITRPTFNDMAPFVFFIDPNTFFAGNIALRPSIVDGLDLSYQLKQWWVSVKYSHSMNEIGFLQPEVDVTNNVQVFRSQNLKYMNTWSITNTIPIQITPWWEAQNNFTFYYQTYETQHLERNVFFEVTRFTANVVNVFTLPKDYSLEIAGNYQSKTIFGMTLLGPMGALNIGIKKKLSNGSITVSANDIFNTTAWKMETNVPSVNIQSSMYYQWNARSFNLTYTRSFGNNKLKSVNVKSGSSEERKRVN